MPLGKGTLFISNSRHLSGQINPLAETSDNKLVAADAKLNFDDNAAYRQKEIFSLRDSSQEDPREVTPYAVFIWISLKALTFHP